MTIINNQVPQAPNSRSQQTNAQKGTGQTQQAQNAAPVAKVDSAAEQAKALATGGSDQAKFTPESQTMLRMTQAAKDVSDINQKKVDRIKEALENGDYPIDAARVAEKMVSLEKLLQG